MDAAPQLLAGKLSKPAFDLIDPGCRCWREMHMIVRPPRQPCPDRCRFVSRVIVHDDVDIEILGDLSVELFNEVQKFGGPMPLVAFADDKAGADVERCEQRGRAMTDIGVSPALRHPRHHRQDWLSPSSALIWLFSST